MKLSSKIYKLGLRLHQTAYKAGILREHELNVPVVCVGNLTVGGTGKTPVVEYVARHYSQQGRKVAILSRGYKKKTGGSGNVIVTDGRKLLCTSDECGDEPFLLAENLTRLGSQSAATPVPVIVNKKRYSAGREAIKRFKSNIVVLDDGFQHLALKKDLSIVVIDSTNPFGNGRLLPEGILREPIDALERAHCVILTHTAFSKNVDKLRREIGYINPDISVFETVHEPDCLFSMKDANIISDPFFLKNKSILLVAGIGNPKSFARTVESLGADVLHLVNFRDHHSYTEQDIAQICQVHGQLRPDFIVVTHKDAVKMKGLELAKISCPLLALKIRIQFTSGEERFKALLDTQFESDSE